MITLLSHTVDDNKEGIAEIPKHYSRQSTTVATTTLASQLVQSSTQNGFPKVQRFPHQGYVFDHWREHNSVFMAPTLFLTIFSHSQQSKFITITPQGVFECFDCQLLLQHFSNVSQQSSTSLPSLLRINSFCINKEVFVDRQDSNTPKQRVCVSSVKCQPTAAALETDNDDKGRDRVTESLSEMEQTNADTILFHLHCMYISQKRKSNAKKEKEETNHRFIRLDR